MKNLSKIAGGIGLLLVLTSLLTLLFGTATLLSLGIRVGLGLVLIVLWAAGGVGAAWNRSAFFFASTAGMVVALVALLAGLNFVAARRGKTWDLTANRVYSLSPQTEGTLRGLKAPVKAIVFVEGGAPEAVENLFRRYREVSEQFSYEFKDPRRTPDLNQRYGIQQGQQTAVLVRQGAAESRQPINLPRLASPQLGEQELTQGLLKLDAVGSQKLYFLQGHGEWSLEPPRPGEEGEATALAVKRTLEEEGYTPSPLNLVDAQAIPDDARALVIAGPRARYSEQEKKLLALYLEQGGRLLYLDEPGGQSGLEPLLAEYGLQLEPGMVADSRVSPDQPYLIITPFLADHEITRLLAKARANVVFATTRAITVLREGVKAGVTTSPLVLTSPYAWIESSLAQDPQPDPGERQGQLTLAALATRSTAGAADKRSDEARVLVFGDVEVMAGAFGYDPDRNLVLNSLAWATQQAQKITIRPPDRDLSSVELTADALATIRVLSLDLLPTLLMGVGLTIWLTRRGR